MKLHLTIFLLCCICLLGSHCLDDREERIRQTVTEQMRRYPASTLQDLYKNFFQDRFGPGHLVADTAVAGSYLREELSTTEATTGVLYEPTGYDGCFYRVSLSLIKEDIVPYATYFDAFLRCVSRLPAITIEEWKKEWQLIDSVIADMQLNLPHYEAHRKEIANRLARGQYVMHHSQAYTEAYDPHYRIIEKERFEKELLPLINQQKP